MEEDGSTLLIGGCYLVLLAGMAFTGMSLLQEEPNSIIIGSAIMATASGVMALVRNRMEEESPGTEE
jgi:hypothetical protein